MVYLFRRIFVHILRGQLGTSRGFAFARFLTLEDSKRFLDDHFPVIDLGDICPRVRLAYSRERDDGATSSEDWRCKNVCCVFISPFPLCVGLPHVFVVFHRSVFCPIILGVQYAFAVERKGQKPQQPVV